MKFITKVKKALSKSVSMGSDVIKIDTLIGKRTAVEGNISIIGNAKIDGKIKGEVKTSGDLVVGEDGEIVGNISTDNIIIAGVVEGNITAKGQVSIKETANVKGEHSAYSLIVDEGSVFVGNCKVLEKKSGND